MIQRFNEGLVDFDPIWWKARNVGQGGIPSTKIVECNFAAETAEFSERCMALLRDSHCGGSCIRRFQEDDEFVATKSGQGNVFFIVGKAVEGLSQLSRNPAQYGVTRRMSEGIVDSLEPVQIHVNESHGFFKSCREARIPVLRALMRRERDDRHPVPFGIMAAHERRIDRIIFHHQHMTVHQRSERGCGHI